MNNNYDILYIIPTKIGNEEAKNKATDINSQLKEKGLAITAENDWGKKRLAYPIKHIRHAFYFELNVSCPKETITEISKFLKLTPEILRYQITESIPKEKTAGRKIELKEKPEEKEEVKKDTSPVTEKKVEEKSKVNIEEIDKKIDEILEEKVK